MREHTLPELQLSVNQGRLDLHVNTGEVSALTLRVLRALALGGQEPHAEPHQPPPQQDEDEIMYDLAEVIESDIKAEVGTTDMATSVLTHLRAQGLLRTPEDARLVAELRRDLDDCRLACRKADRFEELAERAARITEEWKERADKAERIRERLETQLASIGEAYEQHKAMLEAERKRWEACTAHDQAHIDAANKELAELRDEVYERRAAMAQGVINWERITADLDAANKELAELRAAKASLAASLAESEVALSRARKDLELTQAQYERERDARTAAQAEVLRLNEVLAEHKRGLKEMMDGVHAAQAEAQQLRAEKAALEAEAKAAPRWTGGAPVTQEQWENASRLAAKAVFKDEVKP